MSWHEKSPWTEERIDYLKKRWAEGASASVIADEIGYCTRSAVIGKVHRLQLAERKTITIREGGVEREVLIRRTNQARPRRRKNYSPLTQYCGDPALIEQSEADAAVRAEFYVDEVAQLTEDQKAKAVTFMELDEKKHCKWGYGDPRKPDFVFCGCDRIPESPYCGPHTRIAAPRARA
jgi:GcrA cell cycle regulator